MLYFSSSRINRNVRFFASNILWIFVVGYFLYHMFSGARGVVSWTILSKEVEKLEKELKALKNENEFLENKIRRLREDNLDVDLLEEQARTILGFARKNDVIVLLPN